MWTHQEPIFVSYYVFSHGRCDSSCRVGCGCRTKKPLPFTLPQFFGKRPPFQKRIVLAEVVRLVVSSSRQITIQHALFATFSSINNTNNPSVFWKLEKNSPHFVVVVLLWTWVFFTFWIRSIRYQMLMKTSDSSTARQRHILLSVRDMETIKRFCTRGCKSPSALTASLLCQ